VALSRSSSSPFRLWAIRAVAAFLAVYMLGTFGIPTLIPYVAAMIAVALDGLRVARAQRPADSLSGVRREPVQSKRETIH
jgi:hypothetical protein